MKSSSMKPCLLFSTLCAAVLLISCSSNDEYLNARTLPPIVVPDGLDKQALGELYGVPKGDGRLATGELRKPLPPSLASKNTLIEPRVQTFEGNTWLLVPKEASSTWSQLIIYLQSRNIVSIKQDVFAATIDTGWISEAAEPGTALRYQLRLEAGLQPEITEIHAVNIQGTPNSPLPPQTQWAQQSDNVAHQEWFLKAIGKGISAQKAVGDSLIASAISFPEKSVSTTVDGEPVVELSLGLDRAFNALLENLTESTGFTLYEHNKAEGVFYLNEGKKDKNEKVKFTEKLTNFLDKISTAKLTKEGLVTNKNASASLAEILSRLPNEEAVNTLFPERIAQTNADVLSNVSGYLLVLRQVDDNKQRLYIRDGYGRVLAPSKAKILLDTIKKQLY
jgi:outer membrane protein assembly factor BamC